MSRRQHERASRFKADIEEAVRVAAATAEVRGAPQAVLDFEGATIIIRGQRTGEDPVPRQGLQWGIDHFGFNVRGDLDACCDELKRKGVVFTVNPMDFGPNLRIAFLQAPDGVIIELLKRSAKAT